MFEAQGMVFLNLQFDAMLKYLLSSEILKRSDQSVTSFPFLPLCEILIKSIFSVSQGDPWSGFLALILGA